MVQNTGINGLPNNNCQVLKTVVYSSWNNYIQGLNQYYQVFKTNVYKGSKLSYKVTQTIL